MILNRLPSTIGGASGAPVWIIHLAAWDPLGDPPPGTPGGAINLAAYEVGSETISISSPTWPASTILRGVRVAPGATWATAGGDVGAGVLAIAVSVGVEAVVPIDIATADARAVSLPPHDVSGNNADVDVSIAVGDLADLTAGSSTVYVFSDAYGAPL